MVRALRHRRAAVPRPSRARRRGSGSLPPSGPPNQYDYGLIGNLHTAALVSRTGSIDWACLPRFASPSVFARLLDLRTGGFHALQPVEPFTARQQYVPSTAVLETRFDLSRRRRLVLLDLMPVLPSAGAESTGMILRVLEAAGGPVDVTATLDARCDYGRHRPRWRADGLRWVGRSRQDRLTYVPGWPVAPTEGRLDGTYRLAAGERTAFELYWGVERPSRESAYELLRRTEAFWREWTHAPSTPIHRLAGTWHPWVERSEITLKLLSHAETGAFVAAPTTSLPEWIGGPRNWDYRYVWVRDAAFAAQCLLLMGHVAEASGFLRWVLDRPRRTDHGLPVVFGAHGEPHLVERELRHLSGFRNSRPVRVGNAAAFQFQLDIYGELLDAAHVLADVAPDTVAEAWPALASLAEAVARTWRRPDRGIWEIRSPPAHYVHSKVMAWVALDRAARLGRAFGVTGATERWEREAERIRATVLKRGYSERHRSFGQAFGHPAADAANLRLPLVGFLPPTDPRVLGTVRRIEKELAVGPFVYRYHTRDGIHGPEGTFLPCAFWRVDCLALAGDEPRARDLFERLLGVASPLGLFAEEYDPVADEPLGNYPQAFTHIALLRAALTLGLVEQPRTLTERLAQELRVPALRSSSRASDG